MPSPTTTLLSPIAETNFAAAVKAPKRRGRRSPPVKPLGNLRENILQPIHKVSRPQFRNWRQTMDRRGGSVLRR